MNVDEILTIDHVVAENETAEVIGSGGLPVYSTPSMICLMELVSYKLAEKFGYQTVGTKVNISHMKACRPGTRVKATAEVVEFEGRRIVYKVTVEDTDGLMGEGSHERFIIDPERFMAKLG